VQDIGDSTMSTVSFSMRIDEKLKKRLDRLAKGAERPASFLVTKAVEQMVEELEDRQKTIVESFEGDDDGIFVSEASVDSWVRSWASDKRLPKPKPDIFPDARRK
jgi:predicted transcriptional regulator